MLCLLLVISCGGLYALQEARVVKTRVHSDKFSRNVRRGTKKIQKKLEAACDQYDSEQISTGHFLEQCMRHDPVTGCLWLNDVT